MPKRKYKNIPGVENKVCAVCHVLSPVTRMINTSLNEAEPVFVCETLGKFHNSCEYIFHNPYIPKVLIINTYLNGFKW